MHCVLQVYGVSLATNLVLCVGLLLPNTEKLLLVPWLLAHTLLVMALMAAALYYLGAHQLFLETTLIKSVLRPENDSIFGDTL